MNNYWDSSHSLSHSLTLQNVCKHFLDSGTFAVRNFSVDIEGGEFVAVVGPSGSGKTTLLRLIAGLEEVSSGKILLDGQCIQDKKASQRGVAMVFQKYALLPHFSVYKNMALGLHAQGIARIEIDSRVREAARMLGIESLLDRKPNTLSGGQRQRVALGRAIVVRPKIFLLDEPLSGLDSTLRDEMRAEIKRIQTQLGSTFVYVTHEKLEAMTMADRIMVINNGALEQIATPKEIYNNPKTLFVASFFGSPKINQLPCKLSTQTPPTSLDGKAGRNAGKVGLNLDDEAGERVGETGGSLDDGAERNAGKVRLNLDDEAGESVGEVGLAGERLGEVGLNLREENAACRSIVLEVCGASVMISDSLRMPASGQAIMAIRPEAICIANGGESGGEQGKVRKSERGGERGQVRKCESGGERGQVRKSENGGLICLEAMVTRIIQLGNETQVEATILNDGSQITITTKPNYDLTQNQKITAIIEKAVFFEA